MQDITVLKQALPYLRRFRGTVFVVKLGGEALRDHATLGNLAEDIALLDNVGIRIVVVHGGGAQVTELEKQLGIESRFVGGRRITDEATLTVLKMVLAGKMNVELVSALKRHGVRAMGLSGVSAGIIEARRRPPGRITGSGDEVVDFGQVGDIVSIDARPILLALDGGMVPVLSPLGADGEGNVLNINADVVAARLAAELKAEKLMMLTAQLGVMEKLDDPTTLISQLTAAQAREAIAAGIIRGGMIPKVEEALHALSLGVPRVHVLSALEPHQLLLEVFTESGCGTMLLP